MTPPLIAIDLPKTTRTEAIASLQRYFEENLDPLGALPAGLLLNFFLEEIGPVIYNQAIADAQTRLQLQVADLTGELYADPLQYWPRQDAKRKARR
jgi:uncharacterized protein (DUF2164 family)